MEGKQELIQILMDTKRWASDSQNFDLNDMYSSWLSQEELLTEIDQHIVHAKAGTTARSVNESYKLYRLYGPTVGLCEIVTHDSSFRTYMKLASRFDQWAMTKQKNDKKPRGLLRRIFSRS